MHDDLFEAVPDALLTVDADGRILRANAHAEALFGYARGTLPGIAVDALVPAAVRDRHRQHRARYMARPRPRPMGSTEQELVAVRRDGREFPVEIALSPLGRHGGTQFLASIRDISQTPRERQAALRARHHVLERRIGRLALEPGGSGLLVEQLPSLLADALGVASVAIVLVGGGDAARRAQVHGVGPHWPPGAVATPHEALPAEPLRVDGYDTDTAPETAFPFPPAGAEASSKAYLPLVDGDGVAGALLAVSPRPGAFGDDAWHLLQNAAQVLAASLRQRAVEEQLAHAQRLDAIGQLTGGIAHDFNNLLTVVSGSLQLLETECPSAAGQEIIASALRSVGRGADLTGKLLAFARRQHLLPSALDVAALLRDLAVVLRGSLGDAVRLRIDAPTDLPPIHVDAARLEAALLNLALNARDAMGHGGTIDIACDHVPVGARTADAEVAAGDYVRIRVVDSGHGMSASTLLRATEPFFTTKGAGRGSGLGLSMVYGFARQSGGGLRIRSSPGHGTEVALYLPTARRPLSRPPASAPPRGAGRGEAVLVVEDDDAVRGVATSFLEAAGYRVIAAADAEQALRRLDALPPIALLFTDLMLGPGMDGCALAQAVRERRPGVPVLLTSGDEAHAARAAAFPVLRKPYLRGQLAAEVRRLLDEAATGDQGNRDAQ